MARLPTSVLNTKLEFVELTVHRRGRHGVKQKATGLWKKYV